MQKEILEFLEKIVFKIVNPKDILTDIYIFNLQFVAKIKNTCTNKAFEKFPLVLHIYNDFNKNLILTQLPTI